MKSQSRAWNLSFFIIGSILLSLWIAKVVSSFPIYNWDLIPYVASALSYEIDDIEELHESTYRKIRKSIPDSAYQLYISGNYPEHMSNSPEDFYSQLRFYEVKPLYIFFIYSLSKTGIPIVDSIFLISGMSVVLASILLFFWLIRYVPVYTSFALTVLLLIESRLADLARVATPDALSALFIIVSLYVFIEKKALNLSFAILIGSIFVRSNNIIFVSMFIMYFIYEGIVHKNNRKPLGRFRGLTSGHFYLNAYIALGLSIVSYFSIIIVFKPYRWWQLFYHTFIKLLNNPSTTEPSFSFDLYFNVLRNSAKSLLLGHLSLVSVGFCFLLISILVVSNTRDHIEDYKFLIPVICANFVVYFLLFPGVNHWDRFFTPLYIVIAVIAIINFSNRTRIEEIDRLVA